MNKFHKNIYFIRKSKYFPRSFWNFCRWIFGILRKNLVILRKNLVILRKICFIVLAPGRLPLSIVSYLIELGLSLFFVGFPERRGEISDRSFTNFDLK